MFRTAAGRALAVLTLINLFNYIDRYVVASLVESLKKPDALGLSDTAAGFLPTGFLIVYMTVSPVFGVYGDRGARPRLIAAGVLVWSAATALGGFAIGFATLFAARALVGVGEAAYGTIAPGILADHYPRERRGRVLAIFSAAIPVGAALGFVVGGLVDKLAGWRAAFLIAGAPGILLAIVCARLVDPPRGATDASAGVTLSLRDTFRSLVGNRPYVMTVLGYAAYTFAVGGIAYWMPSFLQRVRHVDKGTATTAFGGILVVTGFTGTFLGGWLGDRLLVRHQQAYLWLSGLTTLAAAPFALIGFVAPQPAIYYGAGILTQVLVFVSTGPINSAILNEVPAAQRASAVALSIFTIHVLGDVPAPPLIGVVSDHSRLGVAVLLVPPALAIAGLIWCAEAYLAGRSLSHSAR